MVRIAYAGSLLLAAQVAMADLRVSEPLENTPKDVVDFATAFLSALATRDRGVIESALDDRFGVAVALHYENGSVQRLLDASEFLDHGINYKTWQCPFSLSGYYPDVETSGHDLEFQCTRPLVSAAGVHVHTTYVRISISKEGSAVTMLYVQWDSKAKLEQFGP